MNVNSKSVYYSALSLMIVWMLVGVFPLICYESDSMHVIAGCNTIANQDFITPPLSRIPDINLFIGYGTRCL